MSTIFEPVAVPSIDGGLARNERASGGAIVAGMVVALVMAFWLGLLGVGVGALKADPSLAAPTASAWIGVSALAASFTGGLAAGRLCGAAGNTARWHGLIAWCATALLVLFLVPAAGSILGQMTGESRIVSAPGALYGCGTMLIGAVAAWLGGGLGAPSREEY